MHAQDLDKVNFLISLKVSFYLALSSFELAKAGRCHCQDLITRNLRSD